jgi:hypothetical protein
MSQVYTGIHEDINENAKEKLTETNLKAVLKIGMRNKI